MVNLTATSMMENMALASVHDDELDILSISSSSTHTESPVQQAQVPESSAPRRSFRIQAQPVAARKEAVSQKKKGKRPLPPSDTSDVARKKAKKMEDKKTNTTLHHVKKAYQNTRRNVWLLKHRHLFEPLLPASNNFFTQLREADDIGDASYVPAHQQEQPKNILGQMKDYQLVGLSFLANMYENGLNCILGDEMGLGKTLQTLSLFAYISERDPGARVDPYLIVCPLSVLSSWEAETKRWLPSMTVVRFHGSDTERLRLRNKLRDAKFDIVVTTYEAYVLEDSWFKSHRWTYCVLDEGHKIKNYETNVAHKLQGLNALYRLILTGTPIQNNLTELWSLLHYLYPTIFTLKTLQNFQASFDLSKGTYDLPFLSASQKLLDTLMLRRTKANVALDVPPREEQTVFIPLTEIQRFWYLRLITKLDSVDFREVFSLEGDSEVGIKAEEDSASASASIAYANGRKQVLELLQEGEAASSFSGNSGTASVFSSRKQSQWKKLMNLLLQLRLVCSHPYAIRDVEPEPYFLGEHIVASSSKLIAIDKILADILPKGEKVLIFSQWTRMLNVLEDMMCLRGINYARLDGSTPRARRSLDIKLFQHEKSTLQVYLIASKAGALGINLTKASTVIMADSDWNPQNDLQAIARAHRIGQTKTVKVYRLICGGSVEDQMLDRLRRKLFLSVKIMGADHLSSSGASADPAMGTSALLDILRKGSSALMTDDYMDLTKFIQAPISEILAMSKAREEARDVKLERTLGDGGVSGDSGSDARTRDLLKEAEEEERRLLSGVARVSCRLFEGRMLERGGVSKAGISGKKAEIRDIKEEWMNLRKRVSKEKKTVIVDGMTFIMDPEEDAASRTNRGPEKSKAVKEEKEWQELCIVCEDGGTVFMCNHCPRVFHASCRGLSHSETLKSTFLSCHQHACWECRRGTTDAGGMLYRCRTCPQAYCEDCLPEPWEPLGETLPELELLNYRSSSSAYFINCADCIKKAEKDPIWYTAWQKEIEQAVWTLERKHRDADLNI
ncbi:hypothetical protein D9757_010533 [Collybiopsis confluens]|uniref:Uncharacterized protein n=1 Tax=Collybiopsis confluens TaxID=2823264 RepID=A0A8H5GP57_9AGAR|nr:hypothetical protein D9757_010533 [Collybiopsis confluens]